MAQEIPTHATKEVTRNNSLLGTHATMRTRICKKERSYLIGSFSSCILSILSDMQSADFFSNNLDKIKPERTAYWEEKRRIQRNFPFPV